LIPFLEQQGLSCTVTSPPGGLILGPGMFRGYDVVYWQDSLRSRFNTRRLARFAPTLIFEISLPLFLKRTSRGVGTSRGKLSRFASMVDVADVVVAPNPYLAGYARKFTDDWRIKVLPNGVDLSRWPVKTQPRRQHKIVLGWMGPSSDFRHLEMLEPTLAKMTEYFPDLELRVVSDKAIGFKGVKVGCRRRVERDLRDELLAFDVAVAPYVEDAWSMGQFPSEILLYFALGLPIIASDSMNVRQLVTDHANGLLAGVPEEWEKKIGLLVEAPDLGTKLAEGARRTAEKIYALDRISKGYLSVIHAAVKMAKV
jgi:glycosyltransferase involved in cell wall biosynthesis